MSTAAHQVEGGNVNNWTEWELANASQLAKTAATRKVNIGDYSKMSQFPVWSEIKKQAEDPHNYVSGKGIDHYNRFEEDFDIAKKLNFTAFRFGIEWSRIEPQEGQWDEEAIEHYRDYINELNERGLEPFMNLWHYTLPTWFADKGGFENADNLKYWRRFVHKVSDELLHNVRYVITINEPNVYTSAAYIVGDTPPQKKSVWLFSRVYWHLIRAHRQAYKIIKAHQKGVQVGVAAQLANIQAKRPHNYFDQFSTKWMRYFWNWFFLRRIRKQQDFVGFNYYFTDYYTGLVEHENPKVPVNDMGWYMEPEGLYPLLLRVWARFKKPIFVTENGVADMHDEFRRWWIEETIVAMERALSEGVDLRGYFYWSLLDNFEWAYGWWPKFGLVEVDRKQGMKRTIRPSAHWFAKRIADLKEIH